MVSHRRRRTLEKGDQMRYKATFIVGFAAGFLAGARSGRGTYDKIVAYGQQVASHPKVQEATSAAQTKATELAKSAAAKAPEAAKTAATAAAKTAQEQASKVPAYVSSAKEAAQSKIPARFGGTSDTDPTTVVVVDDVTPDGNLIYPVDGGTPSVNGTRFTPDTDTP
jgi:gas vesicle protein